MPSHPIDFQLQAHNYCTPELQSVFDEQKRMNRWLRVEAALAQAQGELGIIPVEAAREIVDKADLQHLDLEQIKQGYLQSRNSLIPVLKGLRESCGKDFGQYVHYGATTQDVLDTAQVMELQETLQIVYRDLRNVEKILIGMSREHQNTAMIGRTHGQQALPITFGLKTVIWASEIRRHIERVKGIYPRAIFGQLAGAVGTMAALGPQAREVAKRTMELLGLDWKAPGWHTSRDNMVEIASCFTILAGTMEKIANEIFLLGKTEVGELAEPAPGSIMSSTMPHKRNPVLCQRISVLAKHIRSLNGVVVESMAHEHERDPRLLWSEWLAMPQLSMYTGTALNYLDTILDGLVVQEPQMNRNLVLHKDLIMSEWLQFRLAPALGKTAAQNKLHGLMRKLTDGENTLREMLIQDPETSQHITAEDLQTLDHPELYIGLAVELVNDTIAEIIPLRETDPEVLST